MRKLSFLHKAALVAFITIALGIPAAAHAGPGPGRGGGGSQGPSGNHAGGSSRHPGFSGSRPPGFNGGHHFDGHRGFAGHPRSRVFLGFGPGVYWGPAYPYAWDYQPEVLYAPPPAYWYYCASAGAYYPYVASCAEPWVPVAPR